MLPLETAVLMVTCTARPAFSAASDAATTAAADPGDGAVAAGEAAGEVFAGDVAAGDVAGPELAGAVGAGTAFVPLSRPPAPAAPARPGSPASDALRDRFTFLC